MWMVVDIKILCTEKTWEVPIRLFIFQEELKECEASDKPKKVAKIASWVLSIKTSEFSEEKQSPERAM